MVLTTVNDPISKLNVFMYLKINLKSEGKKSNFETSILFLNKISVYFEAIYQILTVSNPGKNEYQ